KLGRGVPMGPGVPKIEGQRGLRIARTVGVDACRRAAQRAAAVGADGEPRRHGAAVPNVNGYGGLADVDRVRFGANAAQFREPGRVLLKGGDEVAVLDVVAEGVEPDFLGGEADLRR